jgi:hypothetical protein
MLSTEDRDQLERELSRLVEMLAELGEDYRSRGVQLFPRSPDADSDSYFTARARIPVTRSSFERPSLASPDQLEKALWSLWKSEGYADLEQLAHRVAALSAKLRNNDDDQSPDVSPFVYAMY